MRNEHDIYDFVIIGAGVVGCAVARELSRYDISAVVVEKECDVALGTSGKNSGVIHAGFNNAPGSLMAELCIEGNIGFESLCGELSVPYKKTGKLVTAFDDGDMKTLEGVIETGKKSGCGGLSLIDKNEMLKLEPNIGGVGAMLSSNTAVINPFEYNLALAQNAYENGVDFLFGFKVTKIEKRAGYFAVSSKGRKVYGEYIINTAGLYADAISKLAGDDTHRIYPCRGEYFVLDKSVSEYISRPVYPVLKPGVGGLGVHLTTTIDGNVLIGPSAQYINSKSAYKTTGNIMRCLMDEAKTLLPLISERDVIAQFSGIRPKLIGRGEENFSDFIIEESGLVANLINLIGIESPGLTASYPIAQRVTAIICNKEKLKKKENFNPLRHKDASFASLSASEQARLIALDKDYGEIVCRCEKVTKKEVIDAIRAPIGARSVIGVKNRLRTTMGRCQGGYCLSRVCEILAKELESDLSDVIYRDSKLFCGKVRGISNG